MKPGKLRSPHIVGVEAFHGSIVSNHLHEKSNTEILELRVVIPN